MKYKYYLRPAFHSKDLLIEIFKGVENEFFLTDLLDCLSEIQPKFLDLKDLWMNDEVILEMKSNIGNFTLSKDIWNLAFIMAEDNERGINKIDFILSKDERFEKVPVNFDNYK